MRLKWKILSSGPLNGTIRPQSDKSLTHRALLFAGLADGKSTIFNPLLGEDCLATIECLRKVGVEITQFSDRLEVIGKRIWDSPSVELYCGNSGTTARLLSGIIASQNITARLTGDASLSQRPMKRITAPLREMGAAIDSDSLPFTIIGGQIRPIEFYSPISSAQVKSCVLLASLSSNGLMIVHEPTKSRDHTERKLAALGADIVTDDFIVRLKVPFEIPCFSTTIPADISSAAYFLVAQLLIPNSNVTLLQVGCNETRTGIYDVLKQIGCELVFENSSQEMGEPNADVRVSPPIQLQRFEISGALVPRLIDEIPVLAVLATQCYGTTIIKDSAEVRVKESDRLHQMALALNKMGADIVETPDGLIINGPTQLNAIEFDANLDHRIAMSLTIAGLIAQGTTILTGIETVASSYPEFLNHLSQLQSEVTVIESTI